MPPALPQHIPCPVEREQRGGRIGDCARTPGPFGIVGPPPQRGTWQGCVGPPALLGPQRWGMGGGGGGGGERGAAMGVSLCALPIQCCVPGGTVGLVTAASWQPHLCQGHMEGSDMKGRGDFVSPAIRTRVLAVHPHGQCPKVPQQWLPASCARSPIQLCPRSPPHAIPLWVMVTSGRCSPSVSQ